MTMPDVWYCPDCEHRMIDCGDVFYCPVCQAHRTYAAMAVQQDVLDVARELAELL